MTDYTIKVKTDGNNVTMQDVPIANLKNPDRLIFDNVSSVGNDEDITIVSTDNWIKTKIGQGETSTRGVPTVLSQMSTDFHGAAVGSANSRESRVIVDPPLVEPGTESRPIVDPPAIFLGAATGAVVGGAVGVLIGLVM